MAKTNPANEIAQTLYPVCGNLGKEILRGIAHIPECPFEFSDKRYRKHQEICDDLRYRFLTAGLMEFYGYGLLNQETKKVTLVRDEHTLELSDLDLEKTFPGYRALFNLHSNRNLPSSGTLVRSKNMPLPYLWLPKKEIVGPKGDLADLLAPVIDPGKKLPIEKVIVLLEEKAPKEQALSPQNALTFIGSDYFSIKDSDELAKRFFEGVPISVKTVNQDDFA